MKLPFKKALLLLFISIISLSCDTNKKSNNTSDNSISQNSQGKVHILTPSEFKEKYENHTIVDIRTPYEFRQGYIKGAININYYSRKFLDNFKNFDKKEPIFIYCRSGSRTSPASRKLVKAGFLNVYDLRGGISNWTRNNNQIKK